MPGDSRPPQQSPLLCTAKLQEEQMEEPEEWTAARKCISPVLFTIYTNDQPLPMDCNRFIYAAILCITTQHSDFQHVEHELELAILQNGHLLLE